MEIGKAYIMQKNLCTGSGHGFEKGQAVTPIPDSETGELIQGAKDSEAIFCGKARNVNGVIKPDPLKGLFVHPDWVQAA